jgi:hypothetical protein
MIRCLKAGGVLAASVMVAAGAAAGPAVLASPALAAAAIPADSPPAWTAVALPLPPLPESDGQPNNFTPLGLSCSSATDCAGVGPYRDAHAHPQAGLLAWNGTTWTATRAPLPADAFTREENATLGGVSCPADGVCYAGGGYLQSAGPTQTSNQGMLLTLSGGKWSAATAPLPADASANPDVSIGGMSCPTTTSCTAVGSYEDPSDDQFGLILTLSDGTWSAAAAPIGADEETVLDAVSCPTLTRCFAAGEQQSVATGADEPVLLGWTQKHGWKVVPVSLPRNAAAQPLANIGGVSCASATRCIAVGQYTDKAGNQEGVLLSLSGKKWTTRKAPLPANAGSDPWVELNAVSCPTAKSCTAGGTFEDSSATSFGLILTLTGKTWTAIAAPDIAFNLHGVSCPSTTNCLALSWGVGQPAGLTGP